MVAVLGVQHPGRLQPALRDAQQQPGAGEAHHHRVAGEVAQRAEGVGALEREGPAVLRRERLRQHHEPPDGVEQREQARGEEGRAQGGHVEAEGERHLHLAEEGGGQRPGDEAHAEGDADEAEVLGALLGRADVGDVGARGAEGRAADAGDDAAHEEPAQGGREGQQEVVEGLPEERHQQHRAPPVAVGDAAHDGREEELHQRVGGRQRADVEGGVGGAADEALHQPRQDGRHQPEAHDVEAHGDHDEAQGWPASRHARRLVAFGGGAVRICVTTLSCALGRPLNRGGYFARCAGRERRAPRRAEWPRRARQLSAGVTAMKGVMVSRIPRPREVGDSSGSPVGSTERQLKYPPRSFDGNAPSLRR